MKAVTKLARVLVAIGDTEQRIESTAAGIFAVIQAAKVKSAKQWDGLVRDAYAANGWNTRAGRPVAGADEKSPVPATVRTYVTIVRQALRSRLKLGRYRSFTALRADLAKRAGRTSHRGSGRKILRLPAPIAGSFEGVDIHTPKPNGALFHDLGVVYAKLPSEHQALLGRQLNRLLQKYMPLAKLALPKPAPTVETEERKAA